MYRIKHFIVTEGRKIYLKETFEVTVKQRSCMFTQKAAVNLEKEVPLGLLNCVRKSEGFYYSISKYNGV